MLFCPVARTRARAFEACVWLLLCAVLLQGGTGAVVQVLGRAHSHQAVPAGVARDAGLATDAAPVAAWLNTVLAWRAERLQALQATAVFRHAAVAPPAHQHDGLERHHHATGDATVQAVDSASTDAGQASAANPGPAWGPTAEYRVATAASVGATWPAAPQSAWSSAPTRLPERPPRA